MDRVVKILDNAQEALKKGLSLPTIFTQSAPARTVTPTMVQQPVQRTCGWGKTCIMQATN
jgi:hypothetical protein